MEQYDYSSELVTKWSQMGRLVGVADDNLIAVAQRLEAAYRRSLGPRGDIESIDREMNSLRREGYYGRPQKAEQVNSRRRRR